ncbi:hypothetical protein Ahia01_001372300, partial [Argonauta hians]
PPSSSSSSFSSQQPPPPSSSSSSSMKPSSSSSLFSFSSSKPPSSSSSLLPLPPPPPPSSSTTTTTRSSSVFGPPVSQKKVAAVVVAVAGEKRKPKREEEEEEEEGEEKKRKAKKNKDQEKRTAAAATTRERTASLQQQQQVKPSASAHLRLRREEAEKSKTEEEDEEEEKRKEKRRAVLLDEAEGEVVATLVGEACAEEGRSFFRREVARRREELARAERCVRLYRAGLVIGRWKARLDARRRRRLYRQRLKVPCSPAWPSMAPLAEQLEDLCGRGTPPPSTSPSLRLAEESDPMTLGRLDYQLPLALTLCRMKRHLLQQKAWYPLDIPDTLGGTALSRIAQRLTSSGTPSGSLYWKLVLSLPSLDQDSSDEATLHSLQLSDWLLAKLSKGEHSDSESDSHSNSLMPQTSVISQYTCQLGKGTANQSEEGRENHQHHHHHHQSPVSTTTTVAPRTLHFCARQVTGTLSPTMSEQLAERRVLGGCGGVLFALPFPGADDNPETYWRHAHHRLATLLQSKPLRPALPVALLVPEEVAWWLCGGGGGKAKPANADDDDEETHHHYSRQQQHRTTTATATTTTLLHERLQLGRLVRAGLVSEAEAFPLPSQHHHHPGGGGEYFDVEHVAVETALCDSIRWLAQHAPTYPALLKKDLKDFVEDSLTTHFYPPLLYNRKVRHSEGYLQQPPDVVISFYNSVVSHLEVCVTDERLRHMSWPVTEFVTQEVKGEGSQSHHHTDPLPPVQWSSVQHQEAVQERLRSLYLPQFHYGDHGNREWQQAQCDVWSYVEAVTAQRPGRSGVQLLSSVRQLMTSVELQFGRVVCGSSVQCVPTYHNMPWVDIILDCVHYTLATLPCVVQGDDRELCVVYDRDRFMSYQPPPSWAQEAAADRTMRESCSLEETLNRAVAIGNEESRHHDNTATAANTTTTTTIDTTTTTTTNTTITTTTTIDTTTTAATCAADGGDSPSLYDYHHPDHHHHHHTLKGALAAEKGRCDEFRSFLERSVREGEEEEEWWWWGEEEGEGVGGRERGREVERDGEVAAVYGDGGGGGEDKRKRGEGYDDDDDDDDDDDEGEEERVSLKRWLRGGGKRRGREEEWEGLSVQARVRLLQERISLDRRAESAMEGLLRGVVWD